MFDLGMAKIWNNAWAIGAIPYIVHPGTSVVCAFKQRCNKNGHDLALNPTRARDLRQELSQVSHSCERLFHYKDLPLRSLIRSRARKELSTVVFETHHFTKGPSLSSSYSSSRNKSNGAQPFHLTLKM